jgi:ABC transport system ATP-binding/permease protein
MSLGAASILTANEIVMSYGTQRLLDGVTLALAPGEKVGLVGRNGCGKTSLFKILAGAEIPDAGEVVRQRGLRIGYLPQEFELEGEKTVRQNIEAGAVELQDWVRRYETGQGTEPELGDLLHRIEAVDGWNLRSRIEAEASALDAPPLDARVSTLSGGEKRRVALCRALVSQPDLLLLDEPTNHLDAESIRWLEAFLCEFPGAAIFITHDRYFLDTIATRILELDGGRCFAHPGNYTSYLESKAIRQQIGEQSERRRQRYLRVELDWVRAGVRAQRSKARHRLETFYTTAGLEAPPEEQELDLLLPPPPELGNTIVNLVNAGAKIGQGAANRWLFRGLTISLKAGQCTGIVGRNGVGKTTLLRLCLGTRAPDEGTVTIGRKVVFNYIDQARMQLNGDRIVLAEVADGADTVLFGSQRLSSRAYLKRFLFPDDRVLERVDRLSGGERARLMLAKVLRHGGNLLVLDEPTNDLDLPSLRMLEAALADFDGTVLVVSHDRYFLDRICDQVIAFESQGVLLQPGNYSYYLEKRLERERSAAAVGSPSVTRLALQEKAASVKPNRPGRRSYKDQLEFDRMESAILEAEARVAELEARIVDPAFYLTRAKEAPAVLAELETAKAQVARLYARWEELEQT